jgi:FkbM family methyltransferase
LSLLEGGSQTRVVAYEPCELTRQYLRQHLEWNGATKQVLVRAVCCGAQKGTAPFYIRPGVPEGINSFIKAEELEEISVDVTTLDDEVSELRLVPQIIKIDVEGAELEVLKGAEKVLRNCRPRLFISLHPNPLAKLGLVPHTIVDWLAERDYQCSIIAEDQELHVMAMPA